MIGRLLKSRGARKFRKNRLAMLSLTVIMGYTLLGISFALANIANWVTGGAVEPIPVANLLLRRESLQPVAPAELPGLGVGPRTTRIFQAIDEHIERGRRGLEAADRAKAAGDDPRPSLDGEAWEDRAFVDLPLEQVRERYQALLDARNEVVALRTSGDQVLNLTTFAAALEEARGEFAAEEDPDEKVFAQEEVGYKLEEFALAAQSAADSAPSGGEALRAQAEALLARAEELYFAEDLLEGELYTQADINAVLAEGPGLTEAIEAVAAERIEGVRGLVDELFVMPTGLDGAIFRFKLAAGTDVQGRSILIRSLYSSYIAMQVGLVVALFAVSFGGLFGAAAAFYGGIVDHVFNWVYSMITSIPYLVLLAVLSFLFLGSAVEGTLIPLYVAMGATYWVGPARVVRGEVLKIKELEYIQATTAMGFGRGYSLLKHVIPNTSHLLFINFSLLLIAAVKGEVILTFLGLGVKNGASWGIMIADSSSQVINQFFWQIGTATFFMFLLVLAFNILTDALQDAFDPRHVS